MSAATNRPGALFSFYAGAKTKVAAIPCRDGIVADCCVPGSGFWTRSDALALRGLGILHVRLHGLVYPRSKKARFAAARSAPWQRDRKSTRLNSSHLGISYAVFCLKK